MGAGLAGIQVCEPLGVGLVAGGDGLLLAALLVTVGVERCENMLGQPLSLLPCLARYMRRGTDLERYYQVRGWKDEHEFKAGSICHLREADINQEVYGLPEWLAALQSALLNESATLFRRKYYNNGSHAGFILYMTDAAQNEDFVDDFALGDEEQQGPGEFPQPVHVRTRWEKGWHPADPDQ